MHTISQEYLIKLPIGYSVFHLLLQLLFFHLNLSLNSLFRFTFSLFCLTRGLFKGCENKNNSKSGNDKKAMKFHDLMVDCIGEKKNFKPEVILESTGEDVGSLSDNSTGGDDTESSGKSVAKQRVKRKRRSRSSAAEMLAFLSSYSEQREKK